MSLVSYSSYIRTPPHPHLNMTAFPSPVGCVKAISPFRGSNSYPWMNVLAAAVNNLVATPCLLCVDATNILGIPIGVARSSGWQNIPMPVSTTTSDAALAEVSEPGDLSRDDVAIAIAVSICCATMQPTIFSRE